VLSFVTDGNAARKFTAAHPYTSKKITSPLPPTSENPEESDLAEKVRKAEGCGPEGAGLKGTGTLKGTGLSPYTQPAETTGL